MTRVLRILWLQLLQAANETLLCHQAKAVGMRLIFEIFDRINCDSPPPPHAATTQHPGIWGAHKGGQLHCGFPGGKWRRYPLAWLTFFGMCWLIEYVIWLTLIGMCPIQIALLRKDHDYLVSTYKAFVRLWACIHHIDLTPQLCLFCCYQSTPMCCQPTDFINFPILLPQVIDKQSRRAATHTVSPALVKINDAYASGGCHFILQVYRN